MYHEQQYYLNNLFNANDMITNTNESSTKVDYSLCTLIKRYTNAIIPWQFDKCNGMHDYYIHLPLYLLYMVIEPIQRTPWYYHGTWQKTYTTVYVQIKQYYRAKCHHHNTPKHSNTKAHFVSLHTSIKLTYYSSSRQITSMITFLHVKNILSKQEKIHSPLNSFSIQTLKAETRRKNQLLKANNI